MKTLLQFYIIPSALCLLITGSILYCAQGHEDASVTDTTLITGINTYITKADVNQGTRRTLSYQSPVTFSHEKHRTDGIQCVTCHHKKGNDERIKTCAFCHKGIAGTETLHKSCIGCHVKKGEGPKACDTCHRPRRKRSYDKKDYAAKDLYKHIDAHGIHNDKGIACVTCHHEHGRRDKKDTYEKCSSCHTGLAAMKIHHALCKGCHITKGAGPVDCKSCHPKAPVIKVGNNIVLPATGHRMERIHFNHLTHVEKYNTECIDCHHTGKNEKCSTCHTMKDQGAVINLKGAFHQQCHDCHRKTAGPKACGKCHFSGIQKGAAAP